MKPKGRVPAMSPTRVLVVDDSAVARGQLTRFLEGDDLIEVVGSAANGRIAIERARELSPDVVVLDLDMPIMDGLAALPKLLEVKPDVKIVVVSALSRPGAEITNRALRSGAVDCVLKPAPAAVSSHGVAASETFRRALVSKVRVLGARRRVPCAVKPRTAQLDVIAPATQIALRAAPRVPPGVLAIGSSTGGPQALAAFLERLGEHVDLPILITQHMPAKFTSMLARHITRSCGRPCAEGKDGDVVERGRIYLAPGGLHLHVRGTARRAVIELSNAPPENFCRPAVDVMFRGVARVFGSRTLAVVLTGIGSDGTLGAQDIVHRGGSVVAQDEASSVVWGMPGSVARAGLCSALLSPEDLASWTNTLLKGSFR